MKYIKVIFLLLAFFLSACGSREKAEEVASVNNSSIPLKEFQHEIKVAKRRDPGLKIDTGSKEDLLEKMIDRKLLIQEAVKKGLSEDERFLETIKTYWEQTLIRNLIDAKNKEWADKLSVSDEEVKKHYNRMGYRITAASIKAKDEHEAVLLKDRMLKGERVPGVELIGPVMIENIQPDDDHLSVAFDLSENEGAVLTEEDGRLYAIKVIKKEKVAAPPLESVYGEIKSTLLERKKEHALDEWLDGIKKRSKIKIDTKNLDRASDEK